MITQVAPISLKDLSVRIENAPGADRELDCIIAEAREDWRTPDKRVMYYGEPTGEHVDDRDNKRFVKCPAYTGSLDAAMMLIPDFALVNFSEIWDERTTPMTKAYRAGANVYESDGGMMWKSSFLALGATPALAVCAVALKLMHEINNRSV